MRPIPPALRKQLADDPFMRRCCMPSCNETKVEFDHVFKYAGKQINERFAIVPLCVFHHRGGGLDRPYTQYIALGRATDAELAKYPRANFHQLLAYLKVKYGSEV